METFAGTLVRSEFRGAPVSFWVENKDDEIQRYHLAGKFYEIEELDIISKYISPGDIYLDIGSNVGNHSVFVGKFLRPSQIINIEPNPLAIRVLEANLSLNKLWGVVDFSLIGKGLSDEVGQVSAIVPPKNLGGTQLKASDGPNTIPLVRADDVLGKRRIDFIKLDVEKMEMQVLAGMKETINYNRPAMFVEIINVNDEKFREFLNSVNYEIIESYRRYKSIENHLILPVERRTTRR